MHEGGIGMEERGGIEDGKGMGEGGGMQRGREKEVRRRNRRRKS